MSYWANVKGIKVDLQKLLKDSYVCFLAKFQDWPQANLIWEI